MSRLPWTTAQEEFGNVGADFLGLGFTLGGLVGSGVSLAIWANPGED